MKNKKKLNKKQDMEREVIMVQGKIQIIAKILAGLDVTIEGCSAKDYDLLKKISRGEPHT